MLPKIKELLKVIIGDTFKYDYTVPNANETTHKTCYECGGTGMQDLFFDCPECKGTGINRKSYQEYVDSLPPL